MRRDATGSDNGTVTIETESTTIVVGRKYRMRVTYTAGPSGVEVGGVLRFKLPGFLVLDFPKGAPVTCSDPNVRLECANSVPPVAGKDGIEFFTIDYLFVTIRAKRLGPGESVRVDYGEHLQSKYAWALEAAVPWKVEAATDLDGMRCTGATRTPIRGYQPTPPRGTT